MDPALAQLGWTDEQWNRICSTVTQEAQKARVAAQVLPVVGPEDSSTVAIPPFSLETQQLAGWPTGERLRVDSNPTLGLTTISVYVPLRGHEIADPDLRAVLTMFRRAANYVARIEDAIVFNGRGTVDDWYIPGPPTGVPDVFRATTDATEAAIGIFTGAASLVALPRVAAGADQGVASGEALITAVSRAVGHLESTGQLGPFGLVLGQDLFDVACTPNGNFVLPRDRILPIIQGPLVRASTMYRGTGALIALSGSPVELVVASDMNVQYLQTTVEPRYVFRVVERIALRIKERDAIATFMVEPN